MSPLREALADYLALRRGLGYKLERAEKLLGQFIDYLEQRGATTITTEQALAWAQLPVDPSPSWLSFRLGAIRGFALYLQTIDPGCEVPPAELVPSRSRRATPYLYSERQIAAAGTLGTPHRTATLGTLIGLLAVTGMRVGEAISLDRGDLDRFRNLEIVWDGARGARSITLGWARFESDGTHAMHRHTQADEILFVERGVGMHMTPARRREMRGPAYDFAPAGEWHCMEVNSGPMEGMFVYLGAADLEATGYELEPTWVRRYSVATGIPASSDRSSRRSANAISSVSCGTVRALARGAATVGWAAVQARVTAAIGTAGRRAAARRERRRLLRPADWRSR